MGEGGNEFPVVTLFLLEHLFEVVMARLFPFPNIPLTKKSDCLCFYHWRVSNGD